MVREGNYFFRTSFAEQLQHDALTLHLPHIDARFDADKLLRALDL
ncbi:MAG: hypothetical protein R2795_17320 [Saprospiraceae bacterium]